MTLNLDAIRQREQAATPGPWSTGADKEWADALPPSALIINANYPLIEMDGGPQGAADAAFIAHARQDIPALLAGVARLTAERDAATEAAKTSLAECGRLQNRLRSARNHITLLMGVLDEVEALTSDTDGNGIDPDAEIPIGEIVRVLNESGLPAMRAALTNARAEAVTA